MYLREIDERREEMLLQGIELYKKVCTEKKSDNEIKIIVSCIGKRLYEKLVSDGQIDDNCYTDIDEAAKEFLRMKRLEIRPTFTFITPYISAERGDEEVENILDFFEKCGYDVWAIRNGRKSFNDDRRKAENMLATTEGFRDYELITVFWSHNNEHHLPWFIMWREELLYNVDDYDGKVERNLFFKCLLDINRYIYGKYEISDDKIKINKIDEYEDIKLDDFLTNICKKAVMVDSGLHDFAKRTGSCCPETWNWKSKRRLENQTTEEENEQLATLAKYGFLDYENGNYYVNSITCCSFIAPLYLPHLPVSVCEIGRRVYDFAHLEDPDRFKEMFNDHFIITVSTRLRAKTTYEEWKKIESLVEKATMIACEVKEQSLLESMRDPGFGLYLSIYREEYNKMKAIKEPPKTRKRIPNDKFYSLNDFEERYDV